MWIDAICINQSNPRERNHQVQLMKQIYNTADRVVVYLGEEEEGDGSAQAMACIADVEGDVRTYSEVAIQALLSRAWFHRLWVVQEVARSRTAVVICGAHTVPWDCFTRWPLRTAAKGPGFDLPGILSYPSGYTPASGSDSLLQLLYNNSNALATDSRDKVFGLLGLMEDNSPYLDLIDYSLPIRDIYFATAMQLLADSRSLRLLSAAGSRGEPAWNGSCSLSHDPTSYSLPSWVPDWNYARPEANLALGKSYVEPFDAGGRPCLIEFDSSYSLSARGVLLGRCLRLSDSETDPLPPRSYDFPRFLDLLGILDHFRDITRVSPSSSQQLRKLMHTVCAWPNSAIQHPDDSESEHQRCFAEILFSSSVYTHRNAWFKSSLAGRASSVIRYRCLFVGEHDLLGLGPAAMQEGDVIVALLGGPTPYVLRPVNKTCSEYVLIGECYVYDHMHGEAFHHIREEVEALGCSLPPTSTGPSYVKLEKFTIV